MNYLCKKHLMGALGRILSDVSWDHGVFRVSIIIHPSLTGDPAGVDLALTQSTDQPS